MTNNFNSPLSLNITSIKHLCFQLKLDEQFISEYLDNRDKIIYSFKTEKVNLDTKKVKIREIICVQEKYKIIHKRIHKNLLQKATLLPAVCGGMKGRTILDFVAIHQGCEGYIAFDLENFFPSIKSTRVYRVFKKSGCSNEISSLLTDLTTFEGYIPQGFSTSVMLANICAHGLDISLNNICFKYNLKYSRWVDDIVISGRIRDIRKASYIIKSAIKKNSFKMNDNKTQFSSRVMDKTVLGLKIQKKPKIPPKYIYEVEKNLKDLVDKKYAITKELFADKTINNFDQVGNSFVGKINYIKVFNPNDAHRLFDYLYMIDWDELESYMVINNLINC